KTIIVKRQNGRVFRDEVEPEDLGFKRSTAEEVSGSDPEENARLTAKILSGHLGRDDPRLQMVLANAAAGLVSGPRMLNTVRTPISRLTEATFFIAGWKFGANMNPIPISSIARSTNSASMFKFRPNCSRTSALPHLLVNDLLPCFATGTPAAAIT